MPKPTIYAANANMRNTRFTANKLKTKLFHKCTRRFCVSIFIFMFIVASETDGTHTSTENYVTRVH